MHIEYSLGISACFNACAEEVVCHIALLFLFSGYMLSGL